MGKITIGDCFIYAGLMGLLNWIPNEIYLKIAYRLKIGKKLNLKVPRSFNEKMQWLKLHDKKTVYNTYVDKYAVRKYIEESIGEEYLIPIIGKWDDVEDIPFEQLPKQFVLKCSHGSGCNIVVPNKDLLNVPVAKKKLRKWLKRNWYGFGREWPYKDLKPCIVAEQYMTDDMLSKESKGLSDYKIHCCNGVPRFVLVCRDRFNGLTDDFFDVEWNHLDVRRPAHPNSPVTINKPANWDEMLHLASKLSSGIPFSRIDFYSINGKTYFGEITLYPASGFAPFVPDEYDEKFGDMIDLKSV